MPPVQMQKLDGKKWEWLYILVPSRDSGAGSSKAWGCSNPQGGQACGPAGPGANF